MKIRRLPLSLLLLAHAVSAYSAESVPNNEVTRAPDVNNALSDNGVQEAPRIVSRGTVDAPVDGQDGRPHEGPFVETSSERDRRKSKESSDPPSYYADNASNNVNEDNIPTSNDGVVDARDRTVLKEGKTGTEGGVSEKGSLGEMGAERTPNSPKEPLPLPDSVYEKDPAYSKKVKNSEEPSEEPFEKPDDLPKTPYNTPSGSSPHGDNPAYPGHSDENEIISPMHSLVLSLTMILVSEIGDKTFLVAALMAMRHPRLVVFSSAFCALIIMTILSAILGHAVPTLIPKNITNFLAAGLFVVFGVKMMLEARAMSPDENVSEEMKEVEMELEEKENMQLQTGRRRSSVNPYSLEAGRARTPRKSRGSTNRLPSPPESVSSSSSRESSPDRGMSFANMASGTNNLLALLLSPAWVQTFVMTFLGEWGDRSQIATITMAAGQDYWWVTCGAITGHGLCTAAAVIGGRAVAGKVSLRVVTFGGSIAFFVFGFLYLIEAIY